MREEGGYRKERQREIEEREETSSSRPERPQRPRGRACGLGGQIWVGGAIIVVGTALLLDNLGIIANAGQILRFWPIVLVGIGVGDLFAARGSGRALRGTLLTAVGILFLLDNVNVINFRIWSLWPLFLIFFGFQMLTARQRRPAAGSGDDAPVDDSEFDEFAFMGGIKRAYASSTFRGGSATTIMGGIELDLRRATMQNDRATVNVFTMMGGVVLRVPEDWAVQSEIVAILGGVDDKTRPPADPKGTLVLTGTMLMGGVEIKD